MNKCFMDTVRQKTNLADNYGKVKNITPLLICNKNNNYRIPTQVTDNSVLLKQANIEFEDIKNLTGRNFNDVIYQRNLPFGTRGEKVDSPSLKQSQQDGINNQQVNLPLKIQSRPVLSGLCINERAIQERDSLDKMNEYVPNNGKCNNTVFVPGKGPINHYFDNIDVESQLKNINEIDTKCSAQLFKVNPNGPDTNLSCFKDNFVKDYQKCEAKNGYTWCNYTDGINYEQFPVCDSKTFSCLSNNQAVNVNNRAVNANNRVVNANNRVVNNQEVNSPSQVVMNNQSGRMVNKNEINNVTKELYLSQRKRELDTQINMRRNDPNFSIKRNNMVQYKGDGINNITAPTIIKQEVDEDMAQILGERAYIEKEIKKITNQRLNKKIEKINVPNPDRQTLHNRINRQVNPDCIHPFEKVDLPKSICREQKKNLYKFQNLVPDTKDCYYCEQLFNNFTKRKTIIP